VRVYLESQYDAQRGVVTVAVSKHSSRITQTAHVDSEEEAQQYADRVALVYRLAGATVVT
jgi:hypothetical protein